MQMVWPIIWHDIFIYSDMGILRFIIVFIIVCLLFAAAVIIEYYTHNKKH